MIGLVGLIVAGLEQLHERLLSLPHLIGLGTMLVAMMIGLLAWESHNYAALFSQSKTLWAYTVQHNRHSVGSPGAIKGDALMHTGRVSEAIEQFKQALKIEPDLRDGPY